MNKTEELLQLGEHFDRMGVTSEDFDRFSANMAAVPKGSAQAGVNRALYATIASLQAQLKNAKSSGGCDGAAEIEKLMKEADYSIYLNVSRATNNILATTTIGNFIAGKPVALPYVLFAFNDQNSNYSASLKNVLGNLNAACPGITYTITQNNGTQIWTWTYPATGKIDVVTISYAGYNTNYLNLVANQSQPGGSFYSRYTNYVISDPVNGGVQGVQADIQFVNITSGGAQMANEILPNSLKSSFEYDATQPARWNLKYPKMHFDATLGAVDTIIACPATDVANGIPFIVQWNMFCDHHESHKSKKH